ncbi:GtrA family protein [Mesorhizobium sp. AaZ16]|uniref:GtrA family protein n=1 Tax=Mesorhizobium sp. AaZ16 TaxID=3402289 RepID=UPI00374EC9E7
MSARFRTALGAQHVRFAVVGIGAAAIMVVLSYVLVTMGTPPFAGSVVAYATAFAVAYTAQRAWTFGARHRHSHALPRYFIIQVGCALMSGGLAHVLVIYLQMPPLAMSVAITVASSVASYLLSSRWAFAAAAPGR